MDGHEFYGSYCAQKSKSKLGERYLVIKGLLNALVQRAQPAVLNTHRVGCH